MIVRGVRDNRPWSWGVLALTVGLAVLSPHPQLLQYMLLASGSFALWLALIRDASGARMSTPLMLTRLGRALGAVVVGFAMGAIQYASVLRYVGWSPRQGGAGWDHAVSYSMPPEELISAIVPQFSGILNDYWGRNAVHLHSEYAGIAVLILAGAGMFATTARRGFRWFWIGTFIVSLLWTLGGFTPFYTLVYYVIPGTKYFRAPSTMMYVAMFSLAVLAALGTERVLRAAATIPQRFVISWAVALVALGVLLAGGLATTIAESFGTADRADANQGAVMMGTVRTLAFAAATLAIVFLTARGRLAPRSVGYAIVAVVGLDLWSVSRKYWIFSAPADELFAADAGMKLMQQDSVAGRVLPIQYGPGYDRADRAFSGDVMMTHRLRSVLGYHGNELGRYQVFDYRVQGGEQAQEAFIRLLRPEFWRHSNVRYLYTTLSDTALTQLATGLQWQELPEKVLGPFTSTVGSTVYLYRLPGENSAAWIATVIVKGTDEQALSTVFHPAFDQTRAAIIDTGSTIQTADVTTPPAPSGVKATVTRFEPGEIDVRLDKPAAAGMGLVVSENFYPGWQATVNGQDAPTTRANYNLIGVALPAGAQEVQLRFTDPAYGTGKAITLVALLIALAAVVAGVILSRRHPRARHLTGRRG